MSPEMEILVPTARFKEKDTELAPPLKGGLTGKSVGFMDNGWPNMRKVFGLFEETLRQRYEVAKVVYERFPASSVPQETLRRIVSRSDVAIVALGN